MGAGMFGCGIEALDSWLRSGMTGWWGVTACGWLNGLQIPAYAGMTVGGRGMFGCGIEGWILAIRPE